MGDLTVNEAHKLIQQLERDKPAEYLAIRHVAEQRLADWGDRPTATAVSDEVLKMMRFEDKWQKVALSG